MPKRVTICRAMSVARSRSSAAPVEISSKTISSAARPPISTAMRLIKLAALDQEAVLGRALHGVAQGADAARDDRDLVHRVHARQR